MVEFVASRLQKLKATGFTALWLPPAQKASVVQSMGYDPYDYYDLGDFEQKGGAKAWLGTVPNFGNLIQSAHDHGFSVYADLVLDHNYGADGLELNPLINRGTADSLFAGQWPFRA